MDQRTISKPGPSVLIVDDEPTILMPLRQTFEEEGFTVHTAVNGAEALRVLEHIDPPDVILLDLLMPVMDGWQFLRAWSEQKRPGNTCVVALSAVAYRGAPGAVQSVAKPVQLDHLLNIVRNLRAAA